MISYHLPEFCIVRLQGKDVSTWLHRLVTTHVKAMPTHHSAWSYLLDAKGKIQFAFEIICYDPHKDNGQMNDSSPIYDCIIECAHADAFMQQLDHFLFTEN